MDSVPANLLSDVCANMDENQDINRCNILLSDAVDNLVSDDLTGVNIQKYSEVNQVHQSMNTEINCNSTVKDIPTSYMTSDGISVSKVKSSACTLSNLGFLSSSRADVVESSTCSSVLRPPGSQLGDSYASNGHTALLSLSDVDRSLSYSHGTLVSSTRSMSDSNDTVMSTSSVSADHANDSLLLSVDSLNCHLPTMYDNGYCSDDICRSVISDNVDQIDTSCSDLDVNFGKCHMAADESSLSSTLRFVSQPLLDAESGSSTLKKPDSSELETVFESTVRCEENLPTITPLEPVSDEYNLSLVTKWLSTLSPQSHCTGCNAQHQMEICRLSNDSLHRCSSSFVSARSMLTDSALRQPSCVSQESVDVYEMAHFDVELVNMPSENDTLVDDGHTSMINSDVPKALCTDTRKEKADSVTDAYDSLDSRSSIHAFHLLDVETVKRKPPSSTNYKMKTEGDRCSDQNIVEHNDSKLVGSDSGSVDQRNVGGAVKIDECHFDKIELVKEFENGTAVATHTKPEVPASRSSHQNVQLADTAVVPVTTDVSLPEAETTQRVRMDRLMKRAYRVGLNMFNIKPEFGIQYLMDKRFVAPRPEAVAHFLLTRKGLCRKALGEYLSSGKPFTDSVIRSFADGIDLTDMMIDVALRKFLSYFMLPGEAEKIEQLMEVFSRRYAQCNEEAIRQFNGGSETVFMIAYAIVLLNTDLYHRCIKPTNRMTVNEFISNLREVDKGSNVSHDLLVGIYNRVKSAEFQPDADHTSRVSKLNSMLISDNVPMLAVPYRRLVSYCQVIDVKDVTKKQRSGSRRRDLFLMNDILLITKFIKLRKNQVGYKLYRVISLSDLSVYSFDTPNYKFGVRLYSAHDFDILLTACTATEFDRAKFLADLHDAVLESSETEINLNVYERKQQLGVATSCNRDRSDAMYDRVSQSLEQAAQHQLASDVNSTTSYPPTGSSLSLSESQVFSGQLSTYDAPFNSIAMSGLDVPSYPAPLPPRHHGLPPPDSISDIQFLPYYHPNLKSMDQVKDLLSRFTSRDGSFILRNSMSKPGQFTISVIHLGGIKHFNIEISPQKTFFLKDIQFRTMQQLISHYTLNEVPNREQIRQVRLLHPISRSGSISQSSADVVTAADGIYIDTISSENMMSGAATTSTGVRRASSAATTGSSSNPSLRSVSVRRASSNNYYSLPTDDSQSKAAELIRSMTLTDRGAAVCHCGLLVEESTLPRGWTVHLSTDPETEGEIYFMAPDGSTRWTLPLEVSLELTADQQDRIRDLIHDFESKTHRTARAKTTSANPSVGAPSPAAKTSCSSKATDPNGDYVGPVQLSAAIDTTVPVFHTDNKQDTPHYMPMNGLHMMARK